MTNVAGSAEIDVHVNLPKLHASLGKAEAATRASSAKMQKAMDSAKSGFVGVDRAADRAAQSIQGVGRKVSSVNDNIAGGAGRARRQTDLLAASTRYLARALVPLGAVIAAAFSIRPLFAFKDALAEVSTLVDTTTFNMGALERAAIEQSAAFGGSAASQVKAYYQIISAGASSATEATDILTAANKLAVGGVTDVRTAADGLTSVLNAYGSQVEGASAVSDALFVAMRAGKTTIGELASSLGKVAPLAAQTGVSFDELTAAVSALTKGGISTREAVTGVRAILAAVAKPTSEAQKVAKQLGLEFNAAALASKGFAGFITDLVRKTGGSTDALSLLFGGVESLIPIMALSGQAGQDLTAILEQMGVKAGATEDAFNKMANSPGFQAGRVWSSLQAEVLKATESLAGPLTAALKAVADNMGNLVKVVKIAGAALLVAFGPAIFSVIVSGFVTMATAGVAAISAITAAMARNPLGALAVGLTLVATALWQFRDQVNTALGVDVAGIVKRVANGTIGAFVGAFDAIKATWSSLPSVMGDLAISAANSVIQAIEDMVNSAIGGINNLINEAKMAALALGRPIDVGFISPVEFGGISNPFGGQAGIAGQKAKDAFQTAMQQDYVGDFFGGGTGGSDAIDQVKKMQEVLDNLNKNVDVGGGGADKAAKKYDKLVMSAQQFIAEQLLEQQTLGMTEQAANALRYEQELLNQAANDNIKLTPEQAAQLKSLAAEMASVEAQTSKLKDAFEFAKATTKGFFSDFVSGLQQGKSVWESFKTAALNALNKIIDKMLTELMDAIFQTNSALGGIKTGGGGGILGGLFGFIGKLFGFDSGGYTGDGPKHKPAGIVHAGEFVFSKAATARIGVRNLEKLHGGARGYADGGYVTPANQNPTPSRIDVFNHVTVSVEDDGAIRAYVRQESENTVRKASPAIASAAVGQVNKQLPSMLNNYQRRTG